MSKFRNWLLFGLSGTDIKEGMMNDHFNEAFFVISKDAFQAYSTSKGYKDIAKLCALVPNSNIFCITKSEEDNQDLSEVIKISRFFEFV